MTKHPIFTAYGLMLIGVAAVADYSGFGLGSVSQTRTDPRSVRDNPGAYRPIYTGYHRYSGGK
jgi:hypothetical protein